MLSIEQMLKWGLAHTARHIRMGDHDRDFATNAFCRAIGLDYTDFYGWLNGRKELKPGAARRMSRFIEQWEAGMLEFKRDKSGKQANGLKRVLVHRSAPRRMPTRMVIDLSGRAPRLQMLGQPTLERMPDFPSLAGPLQLDAKGK